MSRNLLENTNGKKDRSCHPPKEDILKSTKNPYRELISHLLCIMFMLDSRPVFYFSKFQDNTGSELYNYKFRTHITLLEIYHRQILDM